MACDWMARGRYYPAVVTGVNSDGSHRVLYDDGDVEDFVEPLRIMAGGEEDDVRAPPTLLQDSLL